MKNSKKLSVIVFLFVLMFVGLSANTVHAVNVVATVSVGTLPRGVAYDSGRGEILVANYDNNSISVISDSNNSVIATVAVGNQPVSLAYDSGKDEVWVSNNGAGTVSAISDSNGAVTATVTVGTNPEGVAYDSGTNEIYVANWGSNTTSVISDSTNTVIATVPVGDKPIGVAYDYTKNEVFVANSDSSGNGTVSAISDTTHIVVATITVEAGAYGLVYDSSRGEIFVDSCGVVSVVSDSSDTEVASVYVRSGMGIAYDSTEGAIVLSGGDGGAASVVVMSDSTYSILANLKLPTGNVSYGVAYDRAKGEIFVPDGINTLYIVSDSSWSLFSVSPTPTATLTSTESAQQTPSMSPNPSVPEFPVIILPLALSAILVTIMITRKKRITQKSLDRYLSS